MTTLVYRVEHKDLRVGPFNGPGQFSRASLNANALPVPRAMRAAFDGDDGKLLDWLNRTERRFGFASLRDLHHWFDENDRHILRPHDYIIGVYKVRKDFCIYAAHQVAFAWKAAKRVQEIPL